MTEIHGARFMVKLTENEYLFVLYKAYFFSCHMVLGIQRLIYFAGPSTILARRKFDIVCDAKLYPSWTETLGRRELLQPISSIGR
jgi:hypothetical protein